MPYLSRLCAHAFAIAAIVASGAACAPPPSLQEVGEPSAEERAATPETGESADGSVGSDEADGFDGAAEADIPAPGFPAQALRDMTYTIDGEPITLVDGERRMPYMSDSAAENVHVLQDDRVAFGDLDGDGVDDAAAIVVNDPGGSGTFHYLAAVLAGQDGPVNVATLLLGDRFEVRELAISEGMILIVGLTLGPEDPMCCPTVEEIYSYRLEGGALVGGPIEPAPKPGGAEPEG